MTNTRDKRVIKLGDTGIIIPGERGGLFITEGPQPLMREIPPGAAYPVGALGPLREATEAVRDITQAPL